MTIKKVIKGDEARSTLYSGMKTVADVVSATAGPAGRTIAIQKSWGSPKVTKDGVTVAKSVTLMDSEGEGAKMIIQASEKTGRDAGDGTTATCIIASTIAEEGLKSISKGRKSTEIQKGISNAVKVVVESLKSHSKKVTTNEEIRQLATISANGDTEIGDFIAKAIEVVGEKGVVTVEEAKGLKTELEIVDGLQFDQGYLSPYFMTNPERQLVEYDNPYIFLYDGKINNLQSIIPLLENVMEIGRPLIMIADEMADDPLSALVINRIKAGLKVCAVKAPSFGDIRRFQMEDIAILTGGNFISTQFGAQLEKVTIDDLGSCDKIRITPTETIIIGGHGSKEAIDERAKQISEEIENTDSSYDKEKLRERLAKLIGGVAVIKVGGATETEVKEKKDRVDDAVCATRAALEEGILPGGGVSLVRAQKDLIKELNNIVITDDENVGYEIVLKSLSAPMKKIAENAGKSGEVIVEKVLDNDDYSWGYDAKCDKFCNLVDAGILDATKVVRCALENGSSIAGSLLTVEGLIIDDTETNLKLMSAIRQNTPNM